MTIDLIDEITQHMCHVCGIIQCRLISIKLLLCHGLCSTSCSLIGLHMNIDHVDEVLQHMCHVCDIIQCRFVHIQLLHCHRLCSVSCCLTSLHMNNVHCITNTDISVSMQVACTCMSRDAEIQAEPLLLRLDSIVDQHARHVNSAKTHCDMLTGKGELCLQAHQQNLNTVIQGHST